MHRCSVARTFHMTQRKKVSFSFSRFLKVAKVSDLMTLSGIEFQMVGAVTENAWLVRGTASLGAWLDRSGREGMCGTSSDWRCTWSIKVDCV